MCGIFGYIGTKTNAPQLILEGLKTLEYRGYDSWGIAIQKQESRGKNQEKIKVEKQTGKISEKILNSKFLTLNSTLGIGHTRWATHGGVTVENAHPHLDCTGQIAVLHNGIIENFQELKEGLLQKGHTFKSETDTEVIPHLIEEELARGVARAGEPHRAPAANEGESRTSDGAGERQDPEQGMSFAEAFRNTFNRLKGLNAIVAINTASQQIVAAKTGSPLVIGKGNDELFVASDAAGIVKHTKQVIFLSDNQMAVLGYSSLRDHEVAITLLSLPEGKQIAPEYTTLDWDFEDAEKGHYPHFLLKEIHEQPRIIENLALSYADRTKMLADLIENAYGTFMLGCGTASYAALAGTYLFSNIAKKHVNFTIGSEFEYLEDYLTPKTLVIPISQSGETIDVIAPVEKAKEKGAKIAALVNVIGSTLYRQADHKIVLGAGQEKAVVATKSFMAMVSVLLMTAYTLADRQTDAMKLLKKASANIKKLLQNEHTEQIKSLAEELKNLEHIYLLGRGLSYATAMEATLKIKETSCVHAEGFAGGELKHGVIALIEKGTPCFIFAPNDETYDEIISNAQEVKARGGFIIGIGPKNNTVFDRFFETADIKEATLLSQILIAQLFAYYLALARGIEDPDKPRNLAKSVTVK